MTNSLPENLDTLVREAMEEWQVPGLALAVTRDGEPDWVKAYGLRDVEAGLPVTVDTQFILCSVTKSFTALGLAMLLGRFAYVVPVLALAGSLAAKRKIPASAGTFPTDGPLFVGLLVGVIVILYLLQYFPALSLAPIVEHFLMLGGKTF